ncbi:MAG TPA: hypothetical protein VM327_01760 [Candidatus Thermoplasmatota archaeon]|nr:hypothetical protein [Candidatus Thermoplasmatota archaeon]
MAKPLRAPVYGLIEGRIWPKVTPPADLDVDVDADDQNGLAADHPQVPRNVKSTGSFPARVTMVLRLFGLKKKQKPAQPETTAGHGQPATQSNEPSHPPASPPAASGPTRKGTATKAKGASKAAGSQSKAKAARKKAPAKKSNPGRKTASKKR